MCDVELVEVKFSVAVVETESYKREALSAALAQNDESEVGEAGGEIVGCSGQIGHDELVAMFSETN